MQRLWHEVKYLDLRGLLLRGGEEGEGEEKEEGEGKGRGQEKEEGREGERKGKRGVAPLCKFLDPHLPGVKSCKQ